MLSLANLFSHVTCQSGDTDQAWLAGRVSAAAVLRGQKQLPRTAHYDQRSRLGAAVARLQALASRALLRCGVESALYCAAVPRTLPWSSTR